MMGDRHLVGFLVQVVRREDVARSAAVRRGGAAVFLLLVIRIPGGEEQAT